MASVDQPLKKRKLYDPFPDPLISSHQSFISPSQPLPLSQDEILRRRRNRDEIRSLYDCYRSIRFCVAQKDARLMPNFEQAYLSLITASRGCTSVQRIVAELIPRYASFCPTALEAAAKVSIDMYNWSFGIIMRGEDVDRVAYETAKACIFGLVDICCTASHEAPSSSVISGICSAVFHSVLTFFTSTFDGKDIYQIGRSEIQKLEEPMESFCDLKQEPSDDNDPPLHKLFRLRALSLLRIFFFFPKDLIAASFELLVGGGSEAAHRRGGQYFLNQLLSHLNTNEVTHSSNKISDDLPLHTDSAQYDTESKGPEEANSVSNDNNDSKKPSMLSKNCFIEMALRQEPSLRGWMLSRYKKLCESFSSEVLSEISTFLEKIFGSLSEAIKELDSEENNDDQFDPPKYVSAPYEGYNIPNQHSDGADASSRRQSRGLHDASVSDAIYSEDDDAETDGGQNLKPRGSHLSNKVDLQSRIGGLMIGVRSVSMTGLETGNLTDACPSKSSPKDMPNNQYIPLTRRQPDFRNADPDLRTHAMEVVEKIQASNVDVGMAARISVSGSAPNIFSSPMQILPAQRPASHSQNIWYCDGDPVAMDVFVASKQLWLGSLGHEASEKSVWSQFEDFGPLVQLIFVPAKGFALIEYRNIMDAVRAREYMQGSSPWGGSLCIKFVDRGLGSRGVANNVAIGDSCHVYIGKVSTQWAKDQILHDLLMAGVRKPNIITDLPSESAMLLEFGNPEEAANATTHIRRIREDTAHHTYHDRSSNFNTLSNDKFVSRCQLLVRQIDASLSEEELINIFSRYGELSRWQFNRTSCCCLIEFRSHEAADLAKLYLHGARFGATSILVEFRAENSGTAANYMDFSPHDPSMYNSSIGSSTARSLNTSGYFPLHGDLNPTAMEIKPPNSYLSSLPYKTEGIIHEHVSPRLKMEKDATRAHNEHSFQSNWANTSSAEMMEVGSRKANDFGSCTPLDPSFAGAMTSHTVDQVWQSKKQEFEPQMLAHGTQPYAGGSVIPPHVQAPSFVCPVYFNPNNSWDNSAHHRSMSNQIPTGMTPPDDAHFKARPAVPFLPSFATPISHLHGGFVHRFDHMNSVSSLSSVVPPPPSQPDAPTLFPPPLPLSQPPSVPPPPSSPPPQSGSEPSSFQFGEPCMHYQWRGTLSKSGVPYCTINAIREVSATCGYLNSVSEPADWPASLDVTKRTDIRHVKSTFASTRLHRREVCRLLPSTTSDHKGFQDFISYLKQRECAGVIKVPAGKSLWARLLFILPHSPDTCSLLGISPHPADCLIALVLPKDTTTEGA